MPRGRITRASSAGTMVRGIEISCAARSARSLGPGAARLRRLHAGAWLSLGTLRRECAEDRDTLQRATDP